MWGRALALPPGGVVNVYNPDDVWLMLDRVVRWRTTIGAKPLRHPGVQNVETDVGHAAQLDRLGRILTARASPGVVFAPAG